MDKLFCLVVLLATILLIASPVASAGPYPSGEELRTSITPIEGDGARATVENGEVAVFAEPVEPEPAAAPATAFFTQTSNFMYLLLAFSLIGLIGYYAFRR